MDVMDRIGPMHPVLLVGMFLLLVVLVPFGICAEPRAHDAFVLSLRDWLNAEDPVDVFRRRTIHLFEQVVLSDHPGGSWVLDRVGYLELIQQTKDLSADRFVRDAALVFSRFGMIAADELPVSELSRGRQRRLFNVALECQMMAFEFTGGANEQIRIAEDRLRPAFERTGQWARATAFFAELSRRYPGRMSLQRLRDECADRQESVSDGSLRREQHAAVAGGNTAI